LKNSIEQIKELIEPTVTALGLELWGVELLQQSKSSLLRIYIEREEGVAIEDCEKVSRQVSALLDVEDPIAGEYTLEVSSPGVERPLFTAEQFAQYVGSEVKLKLRSPIQGSRKFKGLIAKVDGSAINLHADELDVSLDHSEVEKANIVF